MLRIVLAFLLSASAVEAQSWMQWGMNSQHTGSVIVAAQPPSRILAEVVHDPFTKLMAEDGGDDLLAHYQAPLLDGRNVFMSLKSGTYVSCNPPGSGSPSPCGFDAWDQLIWGVQNLRWVNGELKPRWKFESDWKPVPSQNTIGWEPVFHFALGQRHVYVPAAGGDVLVLRRSDGKVVKRLQPFGSDIDANKYVAGPITVDANEENIFYNVLQLDPQDAWGRGRDIPGAWLVNIRKDGISKTADYKTLIADAPTVCRGIFTNAELPWPPTPTATPASSAPCYSQRPGINIAPAVAQDGTIYSVSRGHGSFGAQYAYLIAFNPDLSLKWAASLRDKLNDGCGVLLPIGGPNGCRAGTPANGVDPSTNAPPAGIVLDESSASPTVAPDGSVLYGAYTRYNYSRGHMFHFSAKGEYLNAFDFGWDTTPAIYEHDGTYSVVLKENNYPTSSYCGDARFCPARENGPYYIVQLSPDMKPEWRFQNTNGQFCERGEDGAMNCRPGPAGGVEWCINAPAVDALGNVYANSEDGNLYVIAQGGKLVGNLFLNLAIGAAYTPLSIGYDGKIYTMNNGRLFVVGR